MQTLTETSSTACRHPFRDIESPESRVFKFSIHNINFFAAELLEHNTRRRKRLEKLYRAPTEILFKGSFDAVLLKYIRCVKFFFSICSKAKRHGVFKRKWLLVSIQRSNDLKCLNLDRDLWNDSEVQNLISRNFIFWQVQVVFQMDTLFIAYISFFLLSFRKIYNITRLSICVCSTFLKKRRLWL
jgi:hypothetical protein